MILDNEARIDRMYNLALRLNRIVSDLQQKKGGL